MSAPPSRSSCRRCASCRECGCGLARPRLAPVRGRAVCGTAPPCAAWSAIRPFHLVADLGADLDHAVELGAAEPAVDGEADEAALLRRCRREEDRAEHAAVFERIAQRRRLADVASFERDDLRLRGLDVVAERVEAALQVGVVGVQACRAANPRCSKISSTASKPATSCCMTEVLKMAGSDS